MAVATGVVPLTTRETVAAETPARAATSEIVALRPGLVVEGIWSSAHVVVAATGYMPLHDALFVQYATVCATSDLATAPGAARRRPRSVVVEPADILLG